MTPEQIDRCLPRVPAGIPALTGDLTDDEERAVAVRWLLELYREAELVTTGHTGANPPPWPPPAKGSHQSNLGIDWNFRYYVGDGMTGIANGPRHLRGSLSEHDEAQDWSRSR